MLTEREEAEILEWIRRDIQSGKNLIGTGNQGNIHLHQEGNRNYVIKVATGWGIGKLVRWLMLRNEYRAYRRLAKVEGVPCCYGFLDNRYLVLEYVDASSLRETRPSDPDSFFRNLFSLIETLHRAGVAHGDLKNKKNVLVDQGRNPIIIDFGIAVSRKKNGSAINSRLFEAFRQADYNSWVKLKYRILKYVSDHDRRHFKLTPLERFWGSTKRFKKKLRKRRRNRVGERAPTSGAGEAQRASRVERARARERPAQKR